MKASSALHILLVDDSRGDALMIDRAIHQVMPEACDVQRAETLAGTLRLLSQHHFDVALLDRSLPDVVGNSGLQSIQNMAPDLPVVFLTAYKSENAALEAIEQGAQDYLFKDKIDGPAIKRAIQFAIIRKHFESTLQMQANFDPLTGLANRMSFEGRLEMALERMKRREGSIGVLFLDLNRFKPVNDTYGHAMGDRLLVEIGSRIKSCLRPYDAAARFGGDEFAVLIEDIAAPEQCAGIARKMINAIEQPFASSGIDLKVGVSIGVAICGAPLTCGREELIRRADAAMYAAKAMPESACRFWDGSSPVASQALKFETRDKIGLISPMSSGLARHP
ncbi:MAG: diguanylate cyclase [Alphaproteobacteria bacterium]|nr:diguanylate cyclase [Alphaproteobacteria bacterium]